MQLDEEHQVLTPSIKTLEGRLQVLDMLLRFSESTNIFIGFTTADIQRHRISFKDMRKRMKKVNVFFLTHTKTSNLLSSNAFLNLILSSFQLRSQRVEDIKSEKLLSLIKPDDVVKYGMSKHVNDLTEMLRLPSKNPSKSRALEVSVISLYIFYPK